MSNNAEYYEDYPKSIVLLANFISLSIYLIGAYIMSQTGTLWLGFYILYCLWVELKVLKRSCVNCFYFGKSCGLGRGQVCSFLFKKGDPEKFVERNISWIDLAPDFMVFIVPLICGIVLLIINFDILILIAILILAVLSSAGNAIIRGSFVCKHCKQKELGCPAVELMEKRK
ncbi:MAG: hypothetical protein JW871_01440 [Endomicrobiales bacterium]|nr:hypothetical protein [Endomicrobiales bacterium]